MTKGIVEFNSYLKNDVNVNVYEIEYHWGTATLKGIYYGWEDTAQKVGRVLENEGIAWSTIMKL